MRVFSILCFVVFSTCCFAQNKTYTTTQFVVTGKVKAEKTFDFSSLKKHPQIELSDINISCSPKKEDKANRVKAVLLKTVLDSVAYQYEARVQLNQFYFLFEAVDGYKMVFSYNEIYNTEIGNNLYIVTELNGKEVKEMEKSILLLSLKDIKTGSRNMKWLSKIVVCIAE